MIHVRRLELRAWHIRNPDKVSSCGNDDDDNDGGDSDTGAGAGAGDDGHWEHTEPDHLQATHLWP